MTNYSAYLNYQNKIEEVEINQDSEVDHQHPQSDLLLSLKLKLHLNLNHNPNARCLNHNNTLLLNLSQLLWISIPLLVFELCIRSRVMKLEN
jgi:hypothetical protein